MCVYIYISCIHVCNYMYVYISYSICLQLFCPIMNQVIFETLNAAHTHKRVASIPPGCQGDAAAGGGKESGCTAASLCGVGGMPG